MLFSFTGFQQKGQGSRTTSPLQSKWHHICS